MIVKVNDLAKQNKCILGDIQRVITSGNYILGREASAFESEFAEYCEIDYTVGVASGTDALVLAMLACGLGDGNKVIVPSFAPIPVAMAVLQVGAVPVFADIDPQTFTLDPAGIEELAEDAEAIIPVHLFGQMADVVAIKSIAREYNLFVIEDAAQAHGAQRDGFAPGWSSEAACYSFYPTKNLGGIGDSGMVVTDYKGLQERLIALRQYGWDDQRISQVRGQNSRLDEIQAAVLRAKLPRLEQWNQRRRDIAAAYHYDLRDITIPRQAAGAYHVFHQYVIRVESSRNGLKNFLTREGIETSVHYALPIHQHPVFSYYNVDLPETDKAAAEVLSLPCYPEMTDEQVGYVIDRVSEWVNE